MLLNFAFTDIWPSTFDLNQLDTVQFVSLIAFTYLIDVCQSNGNLLAAGGQDIKIYDRREAKNMATFSGIHKSKFSNLI